MKNYFLHLPRKARSPMAENRVAENRVVENYDATRPVAFMHIPKTAGSSLIDALSGALGPQSVVSGYDRCLFGAFADFESIDPAIGKIIHATPDLQPEAGLAVGHFACSTLRQCYPNAQCVTMLREPTSRLLSLWMFWRGHTDAQLAPWGSWAHQVRLARHPLTDFLAAPALACQTDNQITRMLLWPHPRIPEDAFIDPADDQELRLEALSRLDRFAHVDVTENPSMQTRLSNWLGKPLCLRRLNETAAIPEPLRYPLERALTDAAQNRMAHLSRLDLALWTHIAARHLPHAAPGGAEDLRRRTLCRTIARYAAMMAGAPRIDPASAQD